jgi:hypothetical protein
LKKRVMLLRSKRILAQDRVAVITLAEKNLSSPSKELAERQCLQF